MQAVINATRARASLVAALRALGVVGLVLVGVLVIPGHILTPEKQGHGLQPPAVVLPQDHNAEESPGPPEEPRACEQSVGSAVAVAGTPGDCFLKDSTGAWRVVRP